MAAWLHWIVSLLVPCEPHCARSARPTAAKSVCRDAPVLWNKDLLWLTAAEGKSLDYPSGWCLMCDRTESRSVLTMMSSLQLPARGVVGRLSAANVRGVATSLAVSEPLKCPFASDPFAIDCTAVVLTAASLVLTNLEGRDQRQPAKKPAEKVTAPKATIRASRDCISTAGSRITWSMIVDRRGCLRNCSNGCGDLSAVT